MRKSGPGVVIDFPQSSKLVNEFLEKKWRRTHGAVWDALRSKANPVMRVFSKIDVDDLKVGLKLKYLGDEIPYVTKFLNNKGNLLRVYLLPAWVPDSGEWIDVPGNKTATYHISGVETCRTKTRGARKVAPLPDLWHIESPAYPKCVFKLRGEDVCAKFEADLTASSVAEQLEEEIENGLSAREQTEKWLEELRSEGW